MWRSCIVFILLLLTNTQGLPYQAVDSTFRIQQLPNEGLLLDRGWKYRAGDHPDWAKAGYDDAAWERINPTQDIYDIQPLWESPVVWFRLQFTVDSAVRQQTLALLVEQTGASEIYVNGKLLLSLGRVSTNTEEIHARTLPKGQFIVLPLGSGEEQVIAVRFALQRNIPYIQFDLVRPNPALRLQINSVNAAVKKAEADNTDGYEYFRLGVFFILALLHLAFYWLYPLQRANLYFFLYAFCSTLATLTILQAYKAYLVEEKMYLLIGTVALVGSSISFFSWRRCTGCLECG